MAPSCRPTERVFHNEMTKSFEQIAESIALRIGHIYFRPLM